MEDNRLDMMFYKNELGGQERYSDLYHAVKIVLIMSRRNAEPERGFSVKKLILKDNLSERSLVAQRLVFQAIPRRNFLDINVDSKMIADVRMACRRYKDYLEERKQEETDEQKAKDQKRKQKAEIEELLVKKRKLDQEM